MLKNTRDKSKCNSEKCSCHQQEDRKKKIDHANRKIQKNGRLIPDKSIINIKYK